MLRIGARPDGDGHVIFVRDNGIGIAPRYHEYVFQPCRRIPYKDSVKGTGLGLTISRKIVEEHGGRMWVESETGKGTTFLFSLPRRVEAPPLGSDERDDTILDTVNEEE